MQLLGIDNLFFQVEHLEEAIEFYKKLGFKLKLRFPHISAALFEIGNEEPGLILQEIKPSKPSKIWVEIVNAIKAQNECKHLNINGNLLDIPTGLTFEIKDPWGNIIGFADYSKKPQLARLSQSD